MSNIILFITKFYLYRLQYLVQCGNQIHRTSPPLSAILWVFLGFKLAYELHVVSGIYSMRPVITDVSE